MPKQDDPIRRSGIFLSPLDDKPQPQGVENDENPDLNLSPDIRRRLRKIRERSAQFSSDTVTPIPGPLPEPVRRHSILPPLSVTARPEQAQKNEEAQAKVESISNQSEQKSSTSELSGQASALETIQEKTEEKLEKEKDKVDESLVQSERVGLETAGVEVISGVDIETQQTTGAGMAAISPASTTEVSQMIKEDTLHVIQDESVSEILESKLPEDLQISSESSISPQPEPQPFEFEPESEPEPSAPNQEFTNFVNKLNAISEHLSKITAQLERIEQSAVQRLNSMAVPQSSEGRGRVTSPPHSSILSAKMVPDASPATRFGNKAVLPMPASVTANPVPATQSVSPTSFQLRSNAQEAVFQPNKTQDAMRGMQTYLSHRSDWNQAIESMRLDGNEIRVKPSSALRRMRGDEFQTELYQLGLQKGSNNGNGDFYRIDNGGKDSDEFVIKANSLMNIKAMGSFLPAQEIKLSSQGIDDFRQFIMNENKNLKYCGVEMSQDGRQVKIASYSGSAEDVREFLEKRLGLKEPEDFHTEKQGLFTQDKFVINPDKLLKFQGNIESVRPQRYMQEYLYRNGMLDRLEDKVEIKDNVMKIKPVYTRGNDFEKMLIHKLGLLSGEFEWKKGGMSGRDEFEIKLTPEKQQKIWQSLKREMSSLHQQDAAQSKTKNSFNPEEPAVKSIAAEPQQQQVAQNRAVIVRAPQASVPVTKVTITENQTRGPEETDQQKSTSTLQTLKPFEDLFLNSGS